MGPGFRRNVQWLFSIGILRQERLNTHESPRRKRVPLSGNQRKGKGASLENTSPSPFYTEGPGSSLTVAGVGVAPARHPALRPSWKVLLLGWQAHSAHSVCGEAHSSGPGSGWPSLLKSLDEDPSHPLFNSPGTWHLPPRLLDK